MDDNHWKDLARKYYVRLPVWKTVPTPEKMRYWLRKFRLAERDYLEITGYKRIENFMELNPAWPLRAWVGLLLEYINNRDDAKTILRAYER